MSHQDRKSKGQIVVNHESIRQAVNSLFTAKAFQGIKVRRGSKWAPRILVVTALFWSWSALEGLKERFQAARKLTAKIFRWLPNPGETYNGFLKQLRKWHVELQVLCIGERQHLEEMLPELPENTLITADAGFMGYDFWSVVMAAGHGFVIRAGANVRLLKKLGFSREHENTVYLWPDWARDKDLPPLTLRAVWVHDGKQPMCLITNVLSKDRLSDRQIAQIYKARWGIELFFRTFKQTFGRRKLRSHKAEHAQLEADWSLVALSAVCLLAQREIARSGRDPCQL